MKCTQSVKGFAKKAVVKRDTSVIDMLSEFLPQRERVEVTKDLLVSIQSRIELNQSINFGRGQKKGR